MADQIQSTIRSFSNDVSSTYKSVVESLNPQIKYVQDGLKQYRQFQSCMCKQYASLPQKITDFKKRDILPIGNQNTRLIILGFSSLTSVLLLRKFSSAGPLRTVRNLLIAYHALGLIIVPEIYNPYIQCGYSWHLQEVKFTPNP